MTPKSKITEPKKTKKSYTGGYYKKFQIYMGWKKAPAKIPFNLPGGRLGLPREPGTGAPRLDTSIEPPPPPVTRVWSTEIEPSPADPWRQCSTRVPGGRRMKRAQERGIERALATFARACVVAIIALAANHPEASAKLLRTALIEAKIGLLACVALLFALRPLAFSRAGVAACVFVAAWAILAHGYGVGGLRDFSFVTGPVCDVVPAACENGVTRWMMLVIDGPARRVPAGKVKYFRRESSPKVASAVTLDAPMYMCT